LVKVISDAEDAVDGVAPYKGNAEEWYICNFAGGKVKITSNKLGNVDVSEDSTDILIAE
jgi:hypothetical protein